MIFSDLFNKKFGLKLRLPHLVFLTAFLLACMLAVHGFSTALAIDTPQLINPTDFEESTGNPNDPIAGRVLYEPLGIPTFEWTDVGASKYELEVATTAAFGASVVFRLDNLQYTSYTPNGEGETNPGFSLTEDSGIFSDYATFYWHVRAWDTVLGSWGYWSPTREFTRHWGYEVELLQPTDVSVQSQTPYFEWEPVPGASFYQIQVDTSDSFGSLLVNETVDVPVFTPRDTFENDTDLFWRVRAFHRPNNGSITGGRGGPWSEVRKFQMAWSSKTGTIDTRPLQLMPADNATPMTRPLFCWKPVEGALKYRLDVATHPDFVTGSFVLANVESQSTCYYANRDGTYTLNPGTTYYWRVTAYDAKNYPGQSTDEGVGSAAFQFQTSSFEPPQVPAKLSPFPYYVPVMEDTFEDRTVALPTFVWDHVRGATSYELRLDDDPAMTDPAVIVINTENTSYTFTDADTIDLDGNIYYWRVRALGAPQGVAQWNQILDVWPIRIDRSQVEVDSSIKLIQPTYQTEPWTDGFKRSLESVTYYPSFSWTAIAPIGQATYRFQIAYDSGFSNLVHNIQTDLTEYTPPERPEPGNYFWRVRQETPSTGSWSNIGRFIISRNFTFVAPTGQPGSIEINGDPTDWITATVPFYSPSGEASDALNPAYEVDGFYIANDSYNWYLGINLPPGSELGLFFDIDHFDLSGGVTSPEGSDPGFPNGHRPEFAIYWAEDRTQGQVYEWNGSSWTNRGPLSNILATQAYNATNEFLELKIPVTQLDQPGSLSVMMVSMDGSGIIQDRIPNLPGQPSIAALLTESTTPTPLFPANAPQDESLVNIEHNTPVLTWRHNEAGYSGTYFFETFEDETLSNYYDGENGNVPKLGWFFAYNTFWAPQVHYSDNNSYHWRIGRAGFEGASPLHFQKAAYLPTELQFSPLIIDGTLTYTNRTPSFRWQPAQSAPRYVWQLWEGGVRKLEFITMVPYYTPQDAIKDGTYTWKVYAKDARNRNSAEAAQSEFRKVSDVVTVLGVDYTESQLTFYWEPVDFAAHYRIEIADDPQFSKNYWSATTYNTTFTPRIVPRAVEDGAFYWRVFMYDNKNNAGPYIDLQFDLFPNKVYVPFTVSQ